MNQLGKPHGALGVSEYEGIISPAYFVAHIAPSVEPRYVHHLLRTRLYISEYERRGKFMPPSQFDISWEDFRSIPALLPPLPEQRAIARYLDDEAARMDRLIQAQKRLVRLLNERIDTLIRQHISDSPLSHHNATPLRPVKRVLRKVDRRVTVGAPIVTAYRDGEVNSRASRREEGYTLASNESTYQGVCQGDVVLHGLDGFAGAIGTSRADGCCSPVYHVCEALESNDARYLARLLRVLALDGYLGAHATSVRERAVDLRNWDLVGAIRIPVPRQPEQVLVGDLIEKAQPVTEATTRIASRLQEHFHAVTTGAVTGQFNVPKAA